MNPPGQPHTPNPASYVCVLACMCVHVCAHVCVEGGEGKRETRGTHSEQDQVVRSQKVGRSVMFIPQVMADRTGQ